MIKFSGNSRGPSSIRKWYPWPGSTINSFIFQGCGAGSGSGSGRTQNFYWLVCSGSDLTFGGGSRPDVHRRRSQTSNVVYTLVHNYSKIFVVLYTPLLRPLWFWRSWTWPGFVSCPPAQDIHGMVGSGLRIYRSKRCLHEKWHLTCKIKLSVHHEFHCQVPDFWGQLHTIFTETTVLCILDHHFDANHHPHPPHGNGWSGPAKCCRSNRIRIHNIGKKRKILPYDFPKKSKILCAWWRCNKEWTMSISHSPASL